MDAFPLNLILAVATASFTIFLGFLPTKTVSSTFFANETIKAVFAWAFVGFGCPAKIVHYPLLLAFFCFASWWSFRRDKALAGKMWLSLASGLGISYGVMLIISVTPAANPPGLPLPNETFLLASIFLGGAIVGAAYVCYALVQGTRRGINQGLVQRYVGFLFGLSIARAVAILATFFVSSGYYQSKTILPNADIAAHAPLPSSSVSIYMTKTTISNEALLALVLAVIVLPVLAGFAQRAAGFSSRIQPTKYLVAIICVGFLTEVLARLLVL